MTLHIDFSVNKLPWISEEKNSTNRKLMRYKPGYEWTKEKFLLKLFPALL